MLKYYITVSFQQFTKTLNNFFYLMHTKTWKLGNRFRAVEGGGGGGMEGLQPPPDIFKNKNFFWQRKMFILYNLTQ